MPEKVRVSPAPTPQLSTGGGQAALVLVPEDDEEPLEVEVLDDFVDEEDEDVSDEDELEDDDSAFAGTVLLPVDRLSLR
jgi:hypothetical protein